jgi:hypothetical protein
MIDCTRSSQCKFTKSSCYNVCSVIWSRQFRVKQWIVLKRRVLSQSSHVSSQCCDQLIANWSSLRIISTLPILGRGALTHSTSRRLVRVEASFSLYMGCHFAPLQLHFEVNKKGTNSFPFQSKNKYPIRFSCETNSSSWIGGNHLRIPRTLGQSATGKRRGRLMNNIITRDCLEQKAPLDQPKSLFGIRQLSRQSLQWSDEISSSKHWPICAKRYAFIKYLVGIMIPWAVMTINRLRRRLNSFHLPITRRFACWTALTHWSAYGALG